MCLDGSVNRATGHVSAQGQGLEELSSARVRDQARCSRCCATSVFTYVHDPSQICHSPAPSAPITSVINKREPHRDAVMRSVFRASTPTLPQ